MGKTILVNLFKTFLFSVIISAAALSIFHTVKGLGSISQSLQQICMAALFLNGILLLMSAPSVLLAYPSLWAHPVARFFLYFAGPAAFIPTSLTMPLSNNDLAAYLMVSGIYIIVYSFFYYRLIKAQKLIQAK